MGFKYLHPNIMDVRREHRREKIKTHKDINTMYSYIVF